jgi:2'-5' RNA ligase
MFERFPYSLYLMALLPPEVIAAIQQIPERSWWKGRPIEDHRLHITIRALGGYPRWPHTAIAGVIDALAGHQIAPFHVGFDQWVVRPDRALLTHSEPLRGVARCQDRLDAALGDRNHPDAHVTIGYGGDEDGGVVPILPISWQVEELVLVLSLNGRHRHLPLHRWPLATT